MIASPSLRRATYAGVWRLIGVGLLLLLSLVAVVVALLLEEYAAVLAVFALLAAATVWRPRYGLYAAIFLALAFEGTKSDPLMFPGYIAQSDVSSWTPIRYINFTPIELLVGLVAILVFGGAIVDRSLPRRRQLIWPVIIFATLLFASTVYGKLHGGGSLNIALWEIRSLAVCCLAAVLVPSVLNRREHVNTMLNLLVLGAIWLSIDIIIRRFTILAGYSNDDLALAFGHETPIYLNMVVLLLVARLIWPASRSARLSALAIPLLLYAEALTARRAGWVTLDVGMLLIVIFIFRLKRRTFWLLVMPLALIYVGYLAAFWNTNSTNVFAQPARAVRSINSPDERDASSNLYRQIEIADIRLNIKAHPLTGLGMGQPFAMYIPLQDLGANWPFWQYTPHDAFLWVWMTMGPLGFVAFLTLIGVSIARGVQLLKRSSSARTAPALVAFVGALLMITVYSYVDLGLTSVRTCALLGLTIGVIAAWGTDAQPAEAVEDEARREALATRQMTLATVGALQPLGVAARVAVGERDFDELPVDESDPYHPLPARQPPGRAVARGALALLSTQPLTWAASLAAAVLLPHYLDASNFGAFAVATSIALLFVTAVSMGLPSFLVRTVAQDPHNAEATVADALLLLTVLNAAVALLAWLGTPLLIHNRLVADVTRISIAASVFSTDLNVLYAYLNGRGQHQRYAWLNAAAVVGSVIVEVGVLAGGGSLHQMVIAASAANAAALVIVWFACGMPYPRHSPGVTRALGLCRSGAPFLTWDLTLAVRARADVVMIAAVVGAASAGWLSADYRIVGIPLFISIAVATPLLPALARCVDDRGAFREVLFNALLSVVLVTLPASVGIAILAPRVPGLMHWPVDFNSAVVPLRILAIQPTLVAADMVLGAAIFAVHRERRWLIVAVIGAAFSPAMNFIAQPLAQHLLHNGATGASIVEVCTECIFFVGALTIIPSTYRPGGLTTLVLRATLCALAMLAVGVLLLQHSLLLTIVASTATYFAVAALTRFVRLDQMRTFLGLLAQQPGG